ncbi:uncharacterized protein [Trachinotus anak]|uniref:uncharacterized protein n=1 Tax=Trachinotus anak TaxID=443729 RepID=UPI0039F24801
MDANPNRFAAVVQTAAEKDNKPPNMNEATLPASIRFRNRQLQIEKYDVLSGKLGDYLIEELLGKGSYGQVFQCIKLDTKEKIAVKIMGKDVGWAGKKEVSILNSLKKIDPDKNNLVRFTDHFEHKGQFCLAFEMLDITIEELIENITVKPLHLSQIRVMAQQMLVALNALKSIGLVHADIKPNNIMLVNHHRQPFKVKLIDFGMAIPVSKIRTGTIMQITGYRAPEVILGLPLNEAVDMWSLGCILAFMYLGRDPYPLHCKHEVMRVIIQLLGQPDDHMLNSGIYTKDFFSKDKDSPGPSWRLKTECVFPCCKNEDSITSQHMGAFHKFNSFDDMAKTRCGVNDATEYEDTQAFLSLLKRMLHVDPAKRITPSEALGHRFITMKHFPADANPNAYMSSAYLTIKQCELAESSVEFKRFVTSSEVLSWSGASITSLDDSLSADEEPVVCTNDESPPADGLDEASNTCLNYGTPATADTATADNNTPPGKARLDNTTTAEIAKKPPGMTQTTSPASVSHKCDNRLLQIEKYDILSGKRSGYLTQKLLGRGAFGHVIQCVRLDTKEKMAVKVLGKDEAWAGKREVAMLKKLNKLDQDKNNLVRFTEHFEHNGHFCLAFEMLDVSIEHFVEKMTSKPLHLSEIRLITEQILVALNALKSIGLAHADIKPDNIMLVNHHLQPFKVKLIDFGLAIPLSKMHPGTVMQAIGYRAPEVILGLPLNEAIDIWGLGCVLAFMYLGQDPYPLHCEREVMRVIMQLLGQPDDRMLNSGIYTKDLFSKDLDSPGPSWRLKPKCTFPCCKNEDSMTNQPRGVFDMFTSFNDLARTRPEVNHATEYEDTQAFLNLLKQMLHVDPGKRITSHEALGHRFITKKHFPGEANPKPCMTSAYSTIKECKLGESSVEFKRSVTSREVVNWNLVSITSLDEPPSADEETVACTHNESPHKDGREAASNTCSNSGTPATADRTAADINNRPPSKAVLDDATTAEPVKKPPGINEASSPASVGHDSNGDNTNTDGETTGFVEVKTRKKYLKRIRRFFSQLFKKISCCSVDVID